MATAAEVRLSRRQYEALRLSAHGLTNRAIARRMKCSPNTVRGHMFAACRKLGVPGGRADAWRALGWLVPPDR